VWYGRCRGFNYRAPFPHIQKKKFLTEVRSEPNAVIIGKMGQSADLEKVSVTGHMDSAAACGPDDPGSNPSRGDLLLSSFGWSHWPSEVESTGPLECGALGSYGGVVLSPRISEVWRSPQGLEVRILRGAFQQELRKSHDKVRTFWGFLPPGKSGTESGPSRSVQKGNYVRGGLSVV